MTNHKIKDYLSENKPLMLAIVVSLVLHITLLSSFLFNIPRIKTNLPILTVSLVKSPMPPLVTSQSEHENSADASINTPTKPTVQSAVLEHTVEPKIEHSLANPNAEITEVKPQALQQTLTVDERVLTSPEPTTPTFSPIESLPPTFKPPSDIVASTENYKRIETDFEVYDSADPNMVSMNRVVFSTQGTKGQNQTYSLTNSLVAGLSANNTEAVQHSSEGTISKYGLKPNYYVGENQRTSFAWSDGIIEINKKFEKLSKGTQDEISYMYQFMFSPPAENTEIVIANGKQLETYRFINLGEQILQTKMGQLKTVHLLKDGEEKIDLWLAVDHQYLPVKVRITAINGNFTEQTATHFTSTLADIESE